jgi:hypothetical protein
MRRRFGYNRLMGRDEFLSLEKYISNSFGAWKSTLLIVSGIVDSWWE